MSGERIHLGSPRLRSGVRLQLPVAAALGSNRKTNKQHDLVWIPVFMGACVCLSLLAQFGEAAGGNSSSEEYVETRMWPVLLSLFQRPV